MWKTEEGSTGRLIQLCLGYFIFYVITGITVKYFLAHGMKGMEFLVYSTAGGSLMVFPVVVARRWYRLQSNELITRIGITFPREFLYIIPSGVCTAVVIPTTTLMYTLPITVMVAMTMMRASVIVVSRIIDAIQIRQGILKKQVYWQENVAVVLALAAVGVHVYYGMQKDGAFDFFADTAATVIFSAYIVAYAIRIYLMNYFKNTRREGVKLDNKGFFAIEQFAATGTLILVAIVVLTLLADGPRTSLMHGAIFSPLPTAHWAMLGGMAFGCAAFFSVFLFMFKGRTATFAGLVNRLTSLVAGTVATLAFWLVFSGKAVKSQDWGALSFILAAVAFLTIAERRRSAELTALRANKSPGC